LKPFNPRNDNIVDENAEIGSALWNYSAACKQGYALMSNGTHNHCFKPKRVKNRSKCYVRSGLCIACDQTVLERKCFACERGMVLGKRGKCVKEELVLPALRRWAGKSRKLAQVDEEMPSGAPDGRLGMGSGLAGLGLLSVVVSVLLVQ
jgi:hypothetical protein